MASFPSRERDPFLAHWHTRVLLPQNVNRTIVAGGLVAGHVGGWPQDGKRLIADRIGREHWGKGIAIRAISEFLLLEPSPRRSARAPSPRPSEADRRE